MDNSHLQNYQTGQDFVINLDASNVRDLGGGSDYVPPGRYQCYVTDLSFGSKEDGSGYNTKMTLQIIAPERQAGLKLINFAAAPFGEKAQNGIATVVKLDKSICSFAGIQAPAGQFQRTRNELIGRPCGVAVEDRIHKGKVVSNITWFITLEEYQAHPGPSDPNHPGTPPDAGVIPASAPPLPTAAVVGGTAPAIMGATPAIPGMQTLAPAAAPAPTMATTPTPAPAGMVAPAPAMAAPATAAPPPVGVAALAGVPAGGNSTPR